jgi:hypothetical protein
MPVRSDTPVRQFASRHQRDLVFTPTPVRNLDCALAAFDKVFVERTLIPPDAALDDEGLFTRRENGRFLFQACTQ